MSKFKSAAAFIILIGIAGTVLFFQEDLRNIYSRLSLYLFPGEISEISFIKIETPIGRQIVGLDQESEKQISTPPPLRVPSKEASQSFLTEAGIIKWTNIQREKYGLPLLKENKKLNASAKEKEQDMFEKQYFAHYSPSGAGVEDLVKSAGYDFIAIGENLALGNFQDDQTVIQGWMDSPGHRANILNVGYQEIGVATVKGVFEGKSVWVAVQHFGLPLSACPLPDEAIKARIQENQFQIEELLGNLETLRIQIQTTGFKRKSAYNQIVKEYNILVSQYNAVIDENRNSVNQYNNQVKLFNECVAEYSR